MTNTPGSRSREPLDDSPPPGGAEAVGSVRRARSSRFSLLLETSVDYTAYRTAYGRQFLQQQPNFDSVRDAETELRCVLHDEAFVSTSADGSIAAENVALAVDWFISALVLLFDGDEPLQNPDFLRLCCMFFASPLYENNARLVQRHLVKRTYAELNTSPGDAYEATLWLLLAFLHLLTEFQSNTYLLCKDSGLFPLLQRLVLGPAERHLHVLAMSLMFEIAQAVSLSQTDIACVTDELLLFLLEYIERMRFAESDVYNNTGTKLVLALNEQFLKLDGYASIPSSSLASPLSNGFSVPHMSVPSSPRSPGSTNIHTDRLLPAIERMSIRATHTRTSSTSLPAADIAKGANAMGHVQRQTLRNPALFALPAESHQLPRSRSMDFRSQLEDEPNALPRSGSDSGKRPSRRQGLHRERDVISGINVAALAGAQPCQPPTPVVAILARRIDCCKTFTENLVFLLNRETDPATQILILHALFCILSDPGTLGILYTNDMYVLVDIIIRDLSNLSDGIQRLSQAYLCVVGSLLRNPVFLATRHRLSDIELCLVNMLRHSLVCSQASVSVPSRRGSASSSSTRHNSITSELAMPVPQSEPHRGSRAVSPVSSLSSSVSEETCFPRSAEDIQSLGVLPKTSRRPAPPPPPSASLRAKTSHQHASACLPASPANGNTTLRPPGHRRRAPPPPPPQLQEARSPVIGHLDRQAAVLSGQLAGLQHALGCEAPTEACGSQRRRHRRPPPPPPTPSSSNASPLLATKPSPHSRVPAPPPPPISSAVARTQRTEHTGLRRQLSVKKSVSIYKRSAGRPAPPPPRSRNASNAAETHDGLPSTGGEEQLMLPKVEVSLASEYGVDKRPPALVNVKNSDMDDDGDSDSSAAKLANSADLQETGEERRTTRRLVEAALRGCHEARIQAALRVAV
ncbi:pre-rRNA processing [Coemansia sp. RSA 922]|nr:pre-rRNA processing [Coemansia sp. S100]KAJ2107337.1 pre-rRNA processing [Coemansia sp. RSA 922]